MTETVPERVTKRADELKTGVSAMRFAAKGGTRPADVGQQGAGAQGAPPRPKAVPEQEGGSGEADDPKPGDGPPQRVLLQEGMGLVHDSVRRGGGEQAPRRDGHEQARR